MAVEGPGKCRLPEVQTVEVVPGSLRQRKPDYMLSLVLSGDRWILLLGGATLGALAQDRMAIAAFLVENRLLWGGGVEEPAARVRAGVPGENDAVAEDEAVASGSRRAL